MGNGKIYRSIATFPSSSSSKTYEVKMDIDSNELSCDCRGWTMKKPGKPRTCKHVQAVENNTVTRIGGVLAAAPDAPEPAPIDLEPVLVGSNNHAGGSLEEVFKLLEEKGL